MIYLLFVIDSDMKTVDQAKNIKLFKSSNLPTVTIREDQIAIGCRSWSLLELYDVYGTKCIVHYGNPAPELIAFVAKATQLTHENGSYGMPAGND